MLFYKYELFFFLSREGIFSSDVERAMVRMIRKRLSSPGVKAWRNDSGDRFSEKFIERVHERYNA